MLRRAVDAARTRPSKFHAGARGTRQPSDNTLASAIRGAPNTEMLTFERVYGMVAVASHAALEGHLCNFLIAMNRCAPPPGSAPGPAPGPAPGSGAGGASCDQLCIPFWPPVNSIGSRTFRTKRAPVAGSAWDRATGRRSGLPTSARALLPTLLFLYPGGLKSSRAAARTKGTAANYALTAAKYSPAAVTAFRLFVVFLCLRSRPATVSTINCFSPLIIGGLMFTLNSGFWTRRFAGSVSNHSFSGPATFSLVIEASSQ